MSGALCLFVRSCRNAFGVTFATCAGVVGQHSAGDAADVLRGENCGYLLQGEIVAGDPAKITPGGSYLEGVRITYYFREAGVPTRARAKELCLSACALAFMGGATRADDAVVSSREPEVGADYRGGSDERFAWSAEFSDEGDIA